MIAKDDNTPNKKKPLTFWQVAHSVLAAFFGVQSSKNYQRDFAQGRPWHYVIMGIALAGIFVGTIMVVVSLVLR